MTANRKKSFAQSAAKKPREQFEDFVVPAHRGFDGLSCYEDGMAGKLRNASDSYIEAQYSYDVPEKTIRLKKHPQPKPHVAKVSPKGQRVTVVLPEHKVYDYTALRYDGVRDRLKYVGPDYIENRYSITVPQQKLNVKNEPAQIKAALKALAPK